MKPSLQLKTSHQLTLTPQLQQSIKLLQLSTLELSQEIERVLLENPMIEREEHDDVSDSNTLTATSDTSSETSPVTDHSAESSVSSNDDNDNSVPEADRPDEFTRLEDSGDWSAGASPSRDDEELDFQEFQAGTLTLRDHLNQQISLSSHSDRDRALLRFLIEALDEHGYLTSNLDDLYALLPTDDAYEPEELKIALQHLQQLDPAGVGARDVAECLALQLKSLPESESRTLALQIVVHHLALLASRNFLQIKRQTKCNDHALHEAHTLICSLNPHPGSEYAVDQTRYITPDVIVRKVKGNWSVSLNPEVLPKLRINALYAGILQDNRGSCSALTQQLQEARWFIKNIQQRFDTILRVSEAIVQQQRAFFEHGEIAMRPLTLREIAEKVDLHESTVSRVTTQKHMATPQGVFELKYFFGSHVATESGGTASSTAIRALIRQVIDAENKKKPLSDSKIAELLAEQGMVVARRTVAKYRESLNIPAVSQRKTI